VVRGNALCTRAASAVMTNVSLPSRHEGAARRSSRASCRASVEDEYILHPPAEAYPAGPDSQVECWLGLRVWHMDIERRGARGARRASSLAIYPARAQQVQLFPRHSLPALREGAARRSSRASVAEGAGRESDQEFRRFLRIAMGSCQELETQIEIVRSLGIGDQEIVDRLVECVDHEGRMLRCLLRRL
jgi:four helix bundle protein